MKQFTEKQKSAVCVDFTIVLDTDERLAGLTPEQAVKLFSSREFYEGGLWDEEMTYEDFVDLVNQCSDRLMNIIAYNNGIYIAQ